MRGTLGLLPPILAVALAAGGCARSDAEQAARELAARAAGEPITTYDLEFRTEVESGWAWRVAPRPAGSAGDLPRATHLGVIVCVDGERATEAVRFSFLHWQPAGCERGRAMLRRARRTPEQDAKELGAFVAPPRGIEDDPALHRVSG